MTTHSPAPGLPASQPGLLTIDLQAIADNWRALSRLVRPSECGAVVKANAYGLGADRIIPGLVAAGCRTFFIATPDEAKAARALAPEATLFVLDGLFPGAEDALLAAGAIPCLASAAEVFEWAAHARRIGARLATALHVDSGLHRLGLTRDEVDEISRAPDLLNALDVRLVMSHLASADDPTAAANASQRRVFDEVRRKLPTAPASLAASDGLMLGPDYHYDLVRPGYALYGGQAFRGGPSPVRPVLTLEARVLQVRPVATGQSVGYSGTWQAERPSRIAIVATGYADGFARSASAPNIGTSPSAARAGGTVLIHGHRLPVVGRVSMDLITVDVTDSPIAVARGDAALLIGPGQPLESVGAEAGTIGYEVLTRLGQRFERRYLDVSPRANDRGT